jgi:hypothetical protein
MSHVPAACEISTRWPFTAMLPSRVAVVRFGAAENGKLPAPCPLLLDMSVSHGTSAVAVHWHSLAVSTVIAPVPPPDPIVVAEAWTVTAHRPLVGATIDVEDDAPQAASSGSSRHDSDGPQMRIGVALKQSRFHERPATRRRGSIRRPGLSGASAERNAIVIPVATAKLSSGGASFRMAVHVWFRRRGRGVVASR